MCAKRPSVVCAAVCLSCLVGAVAHAEQAAQPKPGVERGLCVLVGDARCEQAITIARGGPVTVFVQLADGAAVEDARKAAAGAGLLGSRIFVEQGGPERLHLADNLADLAVVADPKSTVPDAELLRVLRPGGAASVGAKTLRKPAPAGMDDWSHPYHGADNNPQSRDQVARAPYLTQFIAEPAFGCMPEVTVAAGGRVFRAFGHIAFREYQNGVLNTLMAVNANNGTLLWKRPLREGFMIHRNTMIATADTLYLGDDESCKLLDAATGTVRDQIVVMADISDGPVWKWMALEGGVLYGLVGGKEFRPPVQKGRERFIGGWPWGMWPGFEYADPKTAFGFGRTVVAFDLATKKPLWHHREEEFIDSRGVCMRGGRIYFYSPNNFLACLDAKTGGSVWKSTDAGLLAAIGRTGRAQSFNLGFSTSTYLKCNDKALFFAGPQRPSLVAVEASTGKLLWQRKEGNVQLVLRDDAIYAAGAQSGRPTSMKLDYATGNVLASFTDRRACTRATGSIDSVFYRAKEGTVRMVPATGATEHIAPMRPPCHSGVVVSEGLLHWGPWICGCRLSLFGDIALGPAGGFDFHPKVDGSRLEPGAGDTAKVEPLETADGDWAGYRPTCATDVAVGKAGRVLWTLGRAGAAGAAASAAAGLVFVGSEDGFVRAADEATGNLRWEATTGAAVKSPPAVWSGRVFVGSCDGWVYALEARTGRRLWRFRLAPAERWIPVFGRLQSTWPAAGGVCVADGVAYAVAGLAHYDGTFVIALDVVTGKVKWYDDSSGSLSKVKNGISVQGPLYLEGGNLCFAGGNVYPVARYDTRTGRCLNEPVEGEWSSVQSLFYNPASVTAMLKVALGGGRSVAADNRTGKLSIDPAPAKPVERLFATHQAFALAGPTLLVAGSNPAKPGEQAESGGLAALDMKDGTTLWTVELRGCPVRSGIVVTREGRIIVPLTDGRVVCVGAERGR